MIHGEIHGKYSSAKSIPAFLVVNIPKTKSGNTTAMASLGRGDRACGTPARGGPWWPGGPETLDRSPPSPVLHAACVATCHPSLQAIFPPRAFSTIAVATVTAST